MACWSRSNIFSEYRYIVSYNSRFTTLKLHQSQFHKFKALNNDKSQLRITRNMFNRDKVKAQNLYFNITERNTC